MKILYLHSLVFKIIKKNKCLRIFKLGVYNWIVLLCGVKHKKEKEREKENAICILFI